MNLITIEEHAGSELPHRVTLNVEGRDLMGASETLAGATKAALHVGGYIGRGTRFANTPLGAARFLFWAVPRMTPEAARLIRECEQAGEVGL